jgi:hypothetical protein
MLARVLARVVDVTEGCERGIIEESDDASGHWQARRFAEVGIPLAPMLAAWIKTLSSTSGTLASVGLVEDDTPRLGCRSCRVRCPQALLADGGKDDLDDGDGGGLPGGNDDFEKSL